MSTLQLARLSADLVGRTLQVAAVTGATPAPSGGVVLHVAAVWAGIASSAPVVTSPTVTPDLIVDANTQVTMSVDVAGGFTSTDWSQQTGTEPVALAGTDTSKTFTAPALPLGGVLTWAVTAANDTETSDPVFVSVTVRPTPRWYLDGTTWRPRSG